MTNCNGCRHYQPTYLTCSPLRGWLTCKKCASKWDLTEDGVECPKCGGFKAVVDLSECPDGEPSVACPGREEPEPVMKQKGLFDESDVTCRTIQRQRL